MPTAHRGSASRRAPRGRERSRPRTVTGAARGIRWDRVSRVAMLVVLLGILGLYIGPARSYWATLHEASARRHAVALLQRENAHLKARRARLRNPAALESEARRMGMVRPGERSYVLEHLPKRP
jgi:cell division protein FtsB